MSNHQGPRGPYRKGVERRKEIISAAAGLFAESGYTNSSIRELAKRVNLTQAGLLHHFADKEELLVEVLNLRDESVSQYLDELETDDVVARSREVVRHAAEHDGLTSLFIVLSAEAIVDDHPAHRYFVEHYRRASRAGTGSPGGSLPAEKTDAVEADLITMLGAAVQDGLQVQRRYREDVDVVEAMDAFWRLVSTARASWGGEEAPEGGSDAT